MTYLRLVPKPSEDVGGGRRVDETPHPPTPPWLVTPANDRWRAWWVVPGGLWDRQEVPRA